MQENQRVARIILTNNKDKSTNGLRPVNLQTDLGQLADLIETAFSSTMDSGGRSAIREMRQLSRLGIGLGLISSMNDLAQGMSLGYVWVEDGQIVGNVSVYPADYPRELGKAWIIANVAVYPAYRGRGIAKRLMAASLNMIRQRSGGIAVLQVDEGNDIARAMYHKLGFVDERVFTQWYRGRYLPPQRRELSPDYPFRVVGRKLGDSGRELALAQSVRPQDRGGLDWIRPTHIETFRLSPWRRLVNWLNLRTLQRLVVRDEATDSLRAWLQVETSVGVTSHQLLLMVRPDDDPALADALVRTAVRRFGGDGLTMHHPVDDLAVTDVLRQHQFTTRRTVVHMRYKV
jgi:ribosomal protein S18 acetylase RimI-like enzyme